MNENKEELFTREETVEKGVNVIGGGSQNHKDTEFMKKPNKVKRIINIILWIVVLSWMAVVLNDFYNVKKERSPKFCIKSVEKYEDGQVITCTGLGYKVITYERSSMSAIEFGPLWIKDRSK